jgi:DNA-binding transcriptional LysR family regulator
MVADLGSMTAAARALFISQPTVSQAISELEDYYGTRLFDRLSKRLFITEKGSQFLGYARHIATLVNEMEQAVRNPERAGTLKIGASLTIGTCLFPGLVKEFARQYPLMQVKAAIRNTQDIEALITKNAIDFALVEGIVHVPEIVSRSFMEDRLVLVCGKGHPLYGTGSISIADLGGLRFIVREQGSGTRELFENLMALNEIKWQATWECNGSDVLKSAAKEGMGVAVISRRLVQEELEAGTLSSVFVDGLDMRRTFSVIHHKNKYLTPAMLAFIGLCRELPESGDVKEEASRSQGNP